MATVVGVYTDPQNLGNMAADQTAHVTFTMSAMNSARMLEGAVCETVALAPLKYENGQSAGFDLQGAFGLVYSTAGAEEQSIVDDGMEFRAATGDLAIIFLGEVNLKDISDLSQNGGDVIRKIATGELAEHTVRSVKGDIAVSKLGVVPQGKIGCVMTGEVATLMGSPEGQPYFEVT